MLTVHDRINAAWNTGDRLMLHRDVERLADEGVAENVIYDALEKLLLNIREAGADDETEEKIMGVMDRLTGWCAADRRIKIRLRTQVETLDDLPAKLAARAIDRQAEVEKMRVLTEQQSQSG